MMKKYNFIVVSAVTLLCQHQDVQPAHISQHSLTNPSSTTQEEFNQLEKRFKDLKKSITEDLNVDLFSLEEKYPFLFNKNFLKTVKQKNDIDELKRCRRVLEQYYDERNRKYRNNLETIFNTYPDDLFSEERQIFEELNETNEEDNLELPGLHHTVSRKWAAARQPYLKKGCRRFFPALRAPQEPSLSNSQSSSTDTLSSSSANSPSQQLKSCLSRPPALRHSSSQKVSFDLDSNKIFQPDLNLEEFFIIHGTETKSTNNKFFTSVRRHKGFDLLWDEICTARQALDRRIQEERLRKELSPSAFFNETDDEEVAQPCHSESEIKDHFMKKWELHHKQAENEQARMTNES